MNEDFSALVAAEEAKRNRQMSPEQKWGMLQQHLIWSESQATGQRHTKEACLRKQERLLAGLEAWRKSQQK